MKKSMTLTQLEAMLPKLRSEYGDIQIYMGDMNRVTRRDIKVVERIAPKRRGYKFLHIGDW